MTNPICVDLSHHNPTPDWHKLKAGGTQAVIMKATEGTTYVDPTYHQRRADAEAAGLAVFTYHYFRHGNVGAQMSHYLTEVDPKSGERVVIDYEENDCTIPELRAAVKYLLDTDLDLQITVYGGSVLEEHLKGQTDPMLAEYTSLWTAQYNNTGPVWSTQVWPVWSLWQYTDKATVAGISAPVDGNKWNGDPAKFLDWVGPAAQGGQTPVPDEPVVEIVIDVPPGVRVSVEVNGEPWNEVP